MQHREEVRPGKKENRRIHDVVFTACRITCSNCMDRGKDDIDCPVCGPHKIVTFSMRPFSEPEVCLQVVTEDVLKEFVH